MKKLIALVLASFLVALIGTGCGGDTNSGKSNKDTKPAKETSKETGK